MSRNYWYGPKPPADLTCDEARAMPTFFRVARIAHTNYSCERCAECRAEPYVNGSACDEHTEEVPSWNVAGTKLDIRDAELALKVYRAGGNPEPRFTEGIAAAQWNYRRPRRAAERDARVIALTRIVETDKREGLANVA